MCQRCKNTFHAGLAGGTGLRELEKVCANGRTKRGPDYLGLPRAASVPGWMNGSGHYARTAKRTETCEVLAGFWFLGKPVVGLSDAGRKAELGRQAKRLAGQPLAEAA